MDQEKFLKVLNRGLVVALGCTEPISVAYAAALAKKYAGGLEPIRVSVFTSVNVIKNAMSVNIPGTNICGVNMAAALGITAGDPDKTLEVLEGLTEEGIRDAKAMVNRGTVTVEVADTMKKLYIEVVLETKGSNSRVVIADEHTNVVSIEVDGKILRNSSFVSECSNTACVDEYFLNIDSIWDFVNKVDIGKLDIIKKSIELNTCIGREGLENPYGLQVGKTIKANAGKGILNDDLTTYAMALTAAGTDARMAGCTLPVMSNSGSGNQGISATLPVVAAGERLKATDEKIIRGVTLSHLITIYIKSKFGRLSAICGATVAGTGASCGITYLLDGGKDEIKSAIQNMIGNVTGMLCDGAKVGCALKVSTCTNAAVQSAVMAVQGIAIQPTDGIIERDSDKTIENLGRLANQGTNEADKIILDIMVNKKISQ